MMAGAVARARLRSALSYVSMSVVLAGVMVLLPATPVSAEPLSVATRDSAIAAPSGALPEGAYAELRWRLLGPFRGGWATMAAGVPQSPDTFYIGTAGGGVWKTVNAGRTWRSMGNMLPPAIGAIAVAPSSPNIIYAGTGQVAPRYDAAPGRGVFRSIDGGKTWQSLGLAATGAIGRIWVDPRNADVVVAAALGHAYGPNPQRGIYRSSDGGRTWKQVLYINDSTGVVDLAPDPTDPNLLYAAAWQTRDWPWLDYFEPHDGPGSALYRSADGGASWTRLEGGGWPKGPLGRMGLAVTHTTRGTRIYATVHSATQGGVWRSDDGGDHWQRVNDDGALFGSWYFSRLTVDPRNPDILYSAGVSIRRSADAGRTWHMIKGTPGGDDYHFLWINPLHPDHWIAASDQGAVVTLDDGRTWSSWYNQPTGQFYHLATDNRFPYWIYSGQQDSGTVGAASRSDYGSLTFRDWHPVGGEERDYMVPDPDDPDQVFGSGLGGAVSRWDARTGQVANVSPDPTGSYATTPLSVKYRYGWVTPLVFTPTRPHALLLGAQVLFRSTDLGQSWQVISPDLTGAVAGTSGCSAAATGELARRCGFGVISTITPSPLERAEIWVGSDSGRIEVTRDGGAHWRDVTPPQLQPWEKISAISPSALDPATAYVAVDNQRQDDFRPYIFRTRDYGVTWKKIARGMPVGQPVSAVQSDPVRPGLLYAGTTEGVYVSVDDGADWQSLELNLPNAWVKDLLVHGDDLIAATQGRAIWVLDDVTPLRQVCAGAPAAPARLFAPEVAWRVHPNNNRDTPLPPETPQGRNPPAGAIIDYWLGPDVAGPVTLSIYDSGGSLVRRFSSDATAQFFTAKRYFDKSWLKPPARLSAAAGMHRFVWNLRYERPRAISYEYSEETVFGEDTPTAVEGPFVLPGRYGLVLTVAGRRYRAPLVVRLDPRVEASMADLKALLRFSRAASAELVTAKTLYDASTAANDKARLAAISARISSLEASAESSDLPPTGAQERALEGDLRALDRMAAHWRKRKGRVRRIEGPAGERRGLGAGRRSS